VSFHHCSGYHYMDNQVRGFSQFRLSGIGVADYGNILVMPTLNRSGDYKKESSYRAKFDHDQEIAMPGYYAVTLKDSGIRAEITATHHCGVYRFTFPDHGPGRIVFDASHAILKNMVQEAEIKVDKDAGEISGRSVIIGGLANESAGVEIFFLAKVDMPINDYGLFGDRVEGLSASGKKAGAWVEVLESVMVSIGLSFISIEQARRHLDDELGGQRFEDVVKEAQDRWRDALSVIEVKGGTSDQRTIFYTALYHTMIMPTDMTEAGGLYQGFDEQVHEALGFCYYTDFSLWDTFRTLHPFLNLIEPEKSADMMQSLVLMSEQGGYMPKWPTAYRYSSCMIGASADNVIADAYLKGIRGFDVEKAYQACSFMALNPVPEESGYEGRVGIKQYIDKGYVPADLYASSTSRTIEFSYNDWCLANIAKALGREDDYRMFMERSGNWRNIWDEKTGFLRGRNSDGTFSKPFLPWIWTRYYVEGNARQWLWAPFHDVEGLIELMGGDEAFVKRLERFFEKSSNRPDTFLPDTFYWHGNEPDIHAAYLFTYAGRPDLTQKWVRWVMDNKYENSPGGLDGNDDCGTLSAWYIFSAMGFYPLAGSNMYFVGSPIFDHAVIHLKEGDLVIRAEPDPAENIYVRSVTINGKPLKNFRFSHEQIKYGGEIIFEMSNIP
jgi:predicted alpha-1,2-mannosidase